jgi:hypothetical protein
LDAISGREAACYHIAEETTAKYFALYSRYSRSFAEWGSEGRMFGSLLVFPKTYIQSFANDLVKLFNRSGEISVGERFDVIKRITCLLISGAIADSTMSLMTGQRRNDYNPITMLSWQLGGLTLGLVQQAQSAVSDIIMAATGTPTQQDNALAALTAALPQLADVFIPFYNIAMSTLEGITDTKNIDREFLRKVRDLIDKDYTPEQQEKAGRDWAEKLQHIIFNSPGIDPTEYENFMTGVTEAEAKLGTMDAQGRFYTLSQLDGELTSLTKNIPSILVSEDNGMSKLVVFHQQCASLWSDYYDLPSTPSSIRTTYRQQHLDVEAALLFWGKYQRPVDGLSNNQIQELIDVEKILFSLYNIDYRYDLPYFATWELPPK